MQEIFLAIDVGNTNVTFGFLRKGRVVRAFQIKTDLLQSRVKASKVLSAKLGSVTRQGAIGRVYACSVVPAVNRKLKAIIRDVFKKQVFFVGEDVASPMPNKYRVPAQVGQDRLTNALAGLRRYGKGLIVVDFGTAITFDVVSRKGEYLGGLIVPGLKLMQEALSKKTALLPFARLSGTLEAIGRDTASSIRSGLVFGVAGLCDGIIRRLRKGKCRGFKVIATGGDARLIKPFSACLTTIDEQMILYGLYLTYESSGN